MQVKELHLWVKDHAGKWETPGTLHGKPHMYPGRRIVIEPSGTSAISMKLDVARELNKVITKTERYYVVVVAEEFDGTLRYRTIVPMTVVA